MEDGYHNWNLPLSEGANNPIIPVLVIMPNLVAVHRTVAVLMLFSDTNKLL